MSMRDQFGALGLRASAQRFAFDKDLGIDLLVGRGDRRVLT